MWNAPHGVWCRCGGPGRYPRNPEQETPITAGGRITFTDGEPYFDVAFDELTDVTYPWYRFGGGVKLRAAGTLYKITFVRPNGMPSPDPSLGDVALSAVGPGVTTATGAAHVDALRGLADIGTGRKATK